MPASSSRVDRATASLRARQPGQGGLSFVVSKGRAGERKSSSGRRGGRSPELSRDTMLPRPGIQTIGRLGLRRLSNASTSNGRSARSPCAVTWDDLRGTFRCR